MAITPSHLFVQQMARLSLLHMAILKKTKKEGFLSEEKEPLKRTNTS